MRMTWTSKMGPGRRGGTRTKKRETGHENRDDEEDDENVNERKK
jgi:hypothetical protein